MRVVFNVLIIQLLILILIIEQPIASSQDVSECLDIIQAENIPSEILDYASSIVVGYRSTDTFEPIILTNGGNPTDASFLFEIPYTIEGFTSRYIVVELSPDHQKIMQIFSANGTDDLILRISRVINGSIEFVEIDNISDAGITPKWLNSETILLNSRQSETSTYLYDVVKIQDSNLSTITFNLESQARQFINPQLSPDLSHIVFWGLGTAARSIYVYSETMQESVPILNSVGDVTRLQWSPNGNYVSLFSNSNSTSFPNLVEIVHKTGDILVTQELSYGDPFVAPRNSEIVWSPDEHYFTYQNQSTEFRGQTGSLTSIVDIETEEITNICIPGNLFWSPDSQYAAMFLRTERSASPPNRVLGLFVVDMNSQAIYEIPIDRMDDIALEVGWLDINPDN